MDERDWGGEEELMDEPEDGLIVASFRGSKLKDEAGKAGHGRV